MTHPPLTIDNVEGDHPTRQQYRENHTQIRQWMKFAVGNKFPEVEIAAEIDHDFARSESGCEAVGVWAMKCRIRIGSLLSWEPDEEFNLREITQLLAESRALLDDLTFEVNQAKYLLEHPISGNTEPVPTRALEHTSNR